MKFAVGPQSEACLEMRLVALITCVQSSILTCSLVCLDHPGTAHYRENRDVSPILSESPTDVDPQLTLRAGVKKGWSCDLNLANPKTFD